MGDSQNESYDDSFVTAISKDLDMDADLGTNTKLMDMENSVEEDGLDTHIQNSVHSAKGSNSKSRQSLTEDEKIELDNRSIYVGNVDYGSTAKELEQHFKGCGAINRITILTDKYNGHPKGFAYIEFAHCDAVETAMMLDDSEFRSRVIKVMPKRTNIVGYSTTNRAPRRRGPMRGGGGGRMGHYYPRMGGGPMHHRMMGGRFPRRGYSRYSPY